MKIAIIIVRLLMGALFLFASIAGLFHLMPQPELKGNAKLFMDGMTATGYFLTFLMGTELICGLMFVVGLFVPLATVAIFPVTLNILLYHIYVAPDGLGIAIPLMAANLFLA